MPQELWKAIEGYEGLYEISDLGRTRSLGRIRKSKNGSFNCLPIKILKSAITDKGYMNVVLVDSTGTKEHRLVHRLVAFAFIPNPDNRKTVNHGFGNKLDNRASQLEWMTPGENNSHAFETGLRVPVSKKLTWDQVKEIRKVKDGMIKYLKMLTGQQQSYLSFTEADR